MLILWSGSRPPVKCFFAACLICVPDTAPGDWSSTCSCQLSIKRHTNASWPFYIYNVQFYGCACQLPSGFSDNCTIQPQLWRFIRPVLYSLPIVFYDSRQYPHITGVRTEKKILESIVNKYDKCTFAGGCRATSWPRTLDNSALLVYCVPKWCVWGGTSKEMQWLESDWPGMSSCTCHIPEHCGRNGGPWHTPLQCMMDRFGGLS